MSTPSVLLTANVLIIVFLIVAAAIEIHSINKFTKSRKFIRIEKAPVDRDFCEWWTPDILDHYADIEKMATLPGRHLVGTLDNLITPIVPQWYLRDQGGSNLDQK